jgi:4-amino-4-deoxy-L-arabinose transferase-like glycosyltransferase
VFLAGIYGILGEDVLRATIVQALLGGLTVFLLIALTSMLLDWRTALVAGLVGAVYPGFIWLPRLLLSENLSLFLLMLTLVTIALYLRTSRIFWIIAFGAICGINSLVRGANLLLPIAIALGLLIVRWKSRSVNWNQFVAPVLVMTLAFVLTLMPWAIRNYRVFHQLIPVATQDGLTLYGSYWPPQRNGKLIWGTLPGTEDPAIVAAAKTGDEVSASKFLQQLTQQRLREHPGFFFG